MMAPMSAVRSGVPRTLILTVSTACLLLGLVACGGSARTSGTGGTETLDVRTGSTNLDLEAGDTGSSLYSVKAAGGAAVDTNGSTVTVSRSGGGDGTIALTLSSRAAWKLDIHGGVYHETVDMRGGHVAGLDLAAGAEQAIIYLPAPSTTAPVTITGGMSVLQLHLGGRSTLNVPPYSVSGPGPGTYQVDIRAGIGRLSISS